MATGIILKGTKNNDILFGTVDDDDITGRAGDDAIYAGEGNNTVDGGAGNDFIVAGAGNDDISGGAGDDIIDAGDGDNDIRGGAGDDIITTGAGNDTINGGAGNDTINAGDGDNVVSGGGGADSITTGSGNDDITGGADDDVINAGDGNNTIRGGGGQDLITSGSGNDDIRGGDGSDTIDAGDGDNIVDGRQGDDIITTGSGNDTISGGGGNDTINAGDGDNTIDGGADDDIITAGVGNDVISGGAGNDSIDSGGGSDIVEAGNGDDVVTYGVAANLGSADLYDGNRGSDTLRLVLTQAEAADAGIQADIASFQDFLANFANPDKNNGPAFDFSAFDLSVSNFEALEVVVEGAEDTTPPSLIDFSVSTPVVDVSTGAQYVEITIVVSDDISGFGVGAGNGYIDIRANDGSNPVGYGSFEFVGGDPLHTTFTLVTEFVEHSPAGDYPIQLTLFDLAGNLISFSTEDLAGLGFQSTIEVISPDPDIENPEITNFTVDVSSVDVTNGDATIHFTVEATDDVVGFGRLDPSHGAIWLRNADTDEVFGAGSLPITFEFDPSAVFEADVTIPEDAPPGVYDLSILIVDDVYRDTFLEAGDLAALGFVSQITVISNDFGV